MVTSRQLIRGVRKPKSTPKGFGRPQQFGVVKKIYTAKPKKPNSAQRMVAKVELGGARVITVSVPGEKHNLKESSEVLIRGGGAQDLPGVDAEVVPGALDSPGITEGRQHPRSTSRSKYGTPKPK